MSVPGQKFVVVPWKTDYENMPGMAVAEENRQKHTIRERVNGASVSIAVRRRTGEQLWVRNHATRTDVKATDIFIKIVGSDKYQSLLNDKKTQKSKIWENIYEDMKKLGYYIGRNRKEGGVKCSQKWRNLERSYIQFVGQAQTAGAEYRVKRPPAHYEQLREVLKDGHGINILGLMAPLFAVKEQECPSLDEQMYQSQKQQEYQPLKEQEVKSLKEQEVKLLKEQEVKSLKEQEVKSLKEQEVKSLKEQEVKSLKEQEVKSLKEQEVKSLKEQEVKLLKEQEYQSLAPSSVTSKNCCDVEPEEPDLAPVRQKKGEPLWVKRLSTAEDLEATEKFINLVGSDKYQALLNGYTFRKFKVWQLVCEEMTKLGYNVAENKILGGAKCAQKWRNLERSYMEYVAYAKTIGPRRRKGKKPPVQYDLLHAVLKDRHGELGSETIVPSSPATEPESEGKLQPASSSDTSKNRYSVESQSATSKASQENKEEDCIIVPLSPDIEQMLGMPAVNKNQEQHTESDESEGEDVPIKVTPRKTKQDSGGQLWVTNHASATDVEATEAFINIVRSDKYQAVFCNKETRKSHVWQEVYQELKKLGYNVSNNVEEGGAKCAQKWRNLERSYVQYVGHTKSGRAGKGKKKKKNKKPPLYYKQLHSLLKDRINKDSHELMMPPAAAEEQECEPLSSNSEIDIQLSGNSPTSASAVENVKLSGTTPQDILRFVVSEAQKQEKQFSKLCEIMDRQNEEKKRLTDAIIAYLNQSSGPCKRKASETDSD